jgi:hypothetical protein
MARALSIRLASAAGLLALSFVLVGLFPFFSLGPSIGASFVASRPVTSVNRELKGDRLPPPSAINSAFSKSEPPRQRDSKEVPDGCDRSFSPITAPQLAYVYGRCTT